MRRIARGDDDIVQDAMLQAYVALTDDPPRSASESNARAWLATITRNVQLDHLRRAKRRGKFGELYDAWFGGHNDEAANAFRRVSSMEMLGLLESVLTKDERHLFRLMGSEEAYADIAKKLGISISSARQRIHRLRSRMQAILDNLA